MSCIANRKSGLVAISLCVSLASVVPATAGDGNFVFIEQQSASGGPGNTLFVDQSLANNSMVAGATDGLSPAIQHGGDNTARITLGGDSGSVLLSQINSGFGAPGDTNSATIEGGSLARIFLAQHGLGNTGTLNVGEGGNTGALFQKGNLNNGSVTVSGTGNTGTLHQVGNGNTYDLKVIGTSTSVQWNQIGDGIAAASITPAQVYSNAGTVTITQYAP